MAASPALASRSLERTPTWAVAVVCFVLIVISIIIEYILHSIGKWLKKRHKLALNEALEKVKAELMLLGFISLLLVVVQEHIADICIAKSIADTWHPCKLNNDDVNDNYSKKLGSSEDVLGRQRKLLFNNHQLDYSNSYSFYSSPYTSRRILSSYPDYCTTTQGKDKVAFMSTYAIHQLHIFIFVLAVVHVLYSILTMTLSRAKMKSWKKWEYQTRTAEYQYSHDPERFRFARNTTFGRRHLSFWSKTPILLWIVCFFRQFFRSVLKVDYMTLRHGFIMAHLAPQSANKFDFQKYIQRSLEDDFKVVVGISPIIWFFAVLFIMANTHGWFAYLWLPFIPLIIILLVGTKLQVIITKMGVGIQDKGDVVRGVPMVKPTDDLFWFNRPRFILSLIHFVLFQNAFQLAFFVYTTYEFGLTSCYHEHVENIVIQISMGILIQFLCSYVTLPLYALVTQMGSTMKPTIFNERVATALKQWHHTAKKHTKHHEHSSSITPMSSMPTTPTHGSSPIHLLHNHQIEPDSADNEHWESDGSPFHSLSPNHKNQYYGAKEDIQEVASTELQSSPSQTILTVHETMDGSVRQQQINTRLIPGDFSFDKRP